MENETSPTSVTVNELQALVDSWALLRSEIDDIKEILEERNKIKSTLEAKLQSIMSQLDLDKFVGKSGAKVEMRKVDYVTLPATEEDQAAFYGWLKNTGQFDMLASVNHQKLQSWHKAFVEENGLKPVPGLEPIKTRYEIRKGR